MPNPFYSYQFIARCLAINVGENLDSKFHCSHTSLLKAEILADKILWGSIVDVANNNLLISALWVSLNKKELLQDLPEELKAYLDELHHLNTQRNEKLTSQALEVIKLFNSLNIQPVLLKGCSYLFLDTFGDIGTRMMYDLDVMVTKSDLLKCETALVDCGYITDPDDDEKFQNHHHIAPLFRPGEYGSIELHHQPLSKRAKFVLSADEVWANIEQINIENETASVLSPTHRVLHSILHSQVSDQYYNHQVIDLRSLVDLINLVNKDSKSIDWNEISNAMQKKRLRHVLISHLYHANKLFDLQWPQGLNPNIRCRIHYIRCVANIRWERWARFEGSLRRYSREKILQNYDCEDKHLSILKCRIIYTTELLQRWLLGFIRLFHKSSRQNNKNSLD